jgi:serine/threonine-protein kinase
VSGAELVIIAGILGVAALGVTVVRGSNTEMAVTASGDDAAKIEQGSIAVLPFADMSPGKNQTFFSDGLSEELLNLLAKIPELRVAARTSSFSFRDKDVAIDSIGRALRVQYVLEGSVRTAGEQVRITALLIKAADGFHVWSETYDRNLSDIFGVQGEISRAIVDALRLRITSSRQAIAQTDSTDSQTHELVLRAQFEAYQRSEQNLKAADSLFRLATKRDPSYSQAWSGLASVLRMRAYRRFVPMEAGYAEATRAAEHALKLDSMNANAHVVLARVADTQEWDWAAADRQFARAREIQPGLVEIYNFWPWLLMRMGRKEEAIAYAKHATVLDPVSATPHNTLGAMYSYARDDRRAIASFRDAHALRPTSSIIMANLAITYYFAGVQDSAVSYAQKALAAAADDIYANAVMGYIQARTGKHAQARQTLERLKKLPDVSPYVIAMVYTGLEDYDEAFKYLERAVANHDDLLPDIMLDPAFDPVRNDPRMKRIVQRLGLLKT